MKDLKLSAEIVRKVWSAASKEGKALLEGVAGKEYFAARPQGVWILTSDGKAVKPQDWDKYLKTTDAPKPMGVGVVTENAAIQVHTGSSVVLQFGSPEVKNYPKMCFDAETYDSASVTSALIEAHKGVFCKYNDSGIFDFTGAPAAEWCRSLSGGTFSNDLWSLPTLATLKLIQTNVKDINTAMRHIGGNILTPGFHWTSTAKESGDALVVFMGDGNVDYIFKDLNCYVRAVSAFQIEDFEFLNF